MGYLTSSEWAPGLLADWQIRDLCQNHNMIAPFIDHQVSDKSVISYGLSSYGYDARVSNQYKIFTNVNSTIVDPKNFSSESFVDRTGDCCIIPPNSFVLSSTVEYFQIPDDVLVICLGKSTYARTGICINVTPLEASWHGTVTLEFSNSTPLPAKIYSNEGSCQFLFYKGSAPCEITYADRKGKYQYQKGVTLPRLMTRSVCGQPLTPEFDSDNARPAFLDKTADAIPPIKVESYLRYVTRILGHR
jgi:dCTP deaminase